MGEESLSGKRAQPRLVGREGPGVVPSGQTPGRAHGGPHWDVQWPDGKYVNVRPGQNISDVLSQAGL